MRSLIFFLFSSCLVAVMLPAQSCSVLCLNDQWMVKSYQKSETITVSRLTQGILTARETGDVALHSFVADKQLKFKIAIRRNYDTLEMFSEQTFSTFPLEKVISVCQPGEAIVILLADNGDKYSLPHHIIEIEP